MSIQTVATTGTQQTRFNDAARALRKAGVAFKSNVRTCCRSCTVFGDIGAIDADQPYGFTFGGQGNLVRWDENGNPYYVTRTQTYRGRGKVTTEPVDRVYVNHGNGAAETIAAVFAERGFAVEWDGTQGRTVEVIFS